jgi:hypothetical protein
MDVAAPLDRRKTRFSRETDDGVWRELAESDRA